MRVEAARFIRPLPAAPSWWEDTETNNPVRRDTVRIEELTLTGCCQRDGGRRPVNAAQRHFARVIVDLWTAGQSCDFVTLEQTYRHSSLRLEGHRRSRVLELIERMLSAMKNVVSSHIKKWIHCQMFLSVGGCFLGSCIQRSDVTAVSGQRWHGLLIHFFKKTSRRRVSSSSSVSNTKRILFSFLIDKEETAGCFSCMYLQLEVLEDAAAVGTETNHSD